VNLKHEKYAEQEVSCVVSWNTVELKLQVQKGRKFTLAIAVVMS